MSTTDDAKSLKCCLLNELILPVVLVDIVVAFLKWDWPMVNEEVAALDSGGSWWLAVVLERTFDRATIHYLGWPSSFDETLLRNATPSAPTRWEHPNYGVVFRSMLPNAEHDLEGKVIWPTLRDPDRFITSVGGSWKQYPRWPPTSTNPEVKMIWTPDHGEF